MRILLVALTALMISGCAFIVKDGEKEKYYGIDQDRGSSLMQQVIQKQEEITPISKNAK